MCKVSVVGLSGTVYLVIEPNPLLMLDLAEMLEFEDEQAVVIAERNAGAALALVNSVESIKLALVAAGPGDFDNSALAQVIRQKGGRVVLMGDQAEAFGEEMGYSVLHRPFSQSQFLAMLSELRVLPKGTKAAGRR